MSIFGRRQRRCCECGGINGHHMTGCPETPEEPEDDTDPDDVTCDDYIPED